jgi:hypothetical protein
MSILLSTLRWLLMPSPTSRRMRPRWMRMMPLRLRCRAMRGTRKGMPAAARKRAEPLLEWRVA